MSYPRIRRSGFPAVGLAGLLTLVVLLGSPGAAQAQPADIAGSGSSGLGSSTGPTSGSGGSFAAPDPVSTVAAPATTMIKLAGAPNFRDIGGYHTVDGHTVRTGLVFRSSKLGTLTDADLATLAPANVNLDVDLRNSAERTAAPDRVPAGARYQVADVESADGGVSFHAELGNPTAVQLSWLEAAFNEVDRLYGSFDAYVQQGLGLDRTTIATLRANLLS